MRIMFRSNLDRKFRGKIINKAQPNHCQRYAIGLGTILTLTLSFGRVGLAQSSLLPPTPATCDLNLAQLKSADLGKDRDIVTADTTSPAGSTVPSLWWTNEQFSTKLVTNWIANQRQKQIYLLVNAQSWNSLDYVDRYQTIDRFGRAAHDYGYNLKICNSQKVALADYTCGSTVNPTPIEVGLAPASGANQPQNSNNCQIWLHTTGQSGLGIKSK
jgi:hypothetical protein